MYNVLTGRFILNATTNCLKNETLKKKMPQKNKTYLPRNQAAFLNGTI